MIGSYILAFELLSKVTTAVGPNKETQIRDFFPYLSQNSEFLEKRNEKSSLISQENWTKCPSFGFFSDIFSGYLV